jgi:hypothetical protein
MPYGCRSRKGQLKVNGDERREWQTRYPRALEADE